MMINNQYILPDNSVWKIKTFRKTNDGFIIASISGSRYAAWYVTNAEFKESWKKTGNHWIVVEKWT